jgi:hypothetical protein
MYARATADYLSAYGWTSGASLRGHTLLEALCAVSWIDRPGRRATVRALDSFLKKRYPYLRGFNSEGSALGIFNMSVSDKRTVRRVLYRFADEVESGSKG